MKEERFTKSQRRLLEFLATVDPKSVVGYSISEFARKAGVADATVLRFCRALGYAGYSEFRLRIAQEGMPSACALDFMREVERDFRVAVEACNRGTVPNDLDAAVAMLATAESVCCYGVGGCGAAARLFQCRLLALGKNAVAERDGHLVNLRLAARCAGELLVIFDDDGRSKDAFDAAGLARANGVKVMLLTCAEQSPVGRSADLVLVAALTEQNERRSQTALGFFAEALAAGLARNSGAAELLAASAIANAGKRL